MAYYVSNRSFIVLLFNLNFFSSANPIKANDSWLWPNEADSIINERRLIDAPSSYHSSDLTMEQKNPGILYHDNSFSSANTGRQKFSAWKRPKTTTAKSVGLALAKPTSSSSIERSENHLYFQSDKSPLLFKGTNTHQSSIQRDWSFPEDTLIGRKAELKCAEYNRAIANRNVWIHPLTGIWRATQLRTKPGQTNCKGLENPLIIGGMAARSGEFSHMAALGWVSPDNETSFLCGGSLISNSWVITAAHCTHGPLGPPKVVRIGTQQLSDNATGKLIRIEKIMRHPSYKPPAVYADLALLQLDKTLQFGSNIKPACLYTEFDTTPTKAWATGWGVTGIAEDQSDELLKVRLDVVDNVACALNLNRSIAIPRGIVPSMLCAGDIGGDWHSDTCQGDSGGPLQVSHPNHKCLDQIIGITSFGRSCAIKNSPGVYTRISHYLDWIERIVWPDKNQNRERI